MTLTVRLPLRVEERLAEYCVKRKKAKSEVVVDLIEQHLASSETDNRRPIDSARAIGLIGCYDGRPAAAPAKSTKERVRRAIRDKHSR